MIIKKHADIIIIGGGIVGSSILFQLAEAGYTNSILLEKSKFASGSTNASGGFLRVLHNDFEHTKMAFEGLSEFDRIKMNCDFQKTGMVYVINSDDKPKYDHQIEWLKNNGASIDYLSSGEYETWSNIVQLKNTDTVIYEQEAGYLDPVTCTNDWINRAVELGAEAHEGINVQNILFFDNEIKGVRTSFGDIYCNILILAAGAWSSRLVRPLGIDLGMYSKAIQINFFENQKQTTHPIVIDEKSDIYLRPHAGGNSILMGQPTSEFEVNLEQDMSLNHEDTLQLIEQHNPQYNWLNINNLFGGRRSFDGFTRDAKGILKKEETIDGLIIASGWSGGGVKLSPSIGKKVTELVESVKKERTIHESFHRGRV